MLHQQHGNRSNHRKQVPINCHGIFIGHHFLMITVLQIHHFITIIKGLIAIIMYTMFLHPNEAMVKERMIKVDIHFKWNNCVIPKVSGNNHLY